jgi:RHS repeat-associated protein
LLPDGTVLLLGGQNSNGKVVKAAAIESVQSGTATSLAARLNVGRAWHTASVLPDGTVLIIGGIGSDGRVVKQNEIFDPRSQAFKPVTVSGPTPRAFHSATLLTDGTLLIAGGVGSNGQPLRTLEMWDSRNGTLSVAQARLTIARRSHVATLLSDGTVLLSGGNDSANKTLSSGDVFDPQSQTVTQASDPQALVLSSNGESTETRATSPEDGATEIAVDALISMRFSRPLLMGSINTNSVTLKGPTGAVDAKVVGAEGGMLAFVTPAATLLPGTTYSVTFSGGVDLSDATSAYTQFTFTTTGDTSQADDDTWIPTSDWMTHRSSSKWQKLSPLQAPPGVTALAAQVLKLDGNPLQHVTLVIGNRKTLTDGTGRFLLKDIPVGHNTMLVLANTANTKVRSYGIYEIGVDVKKGITNVLRYTIWMTPLDTAHTVKIPSPTLSETVITSPYMPGLELHIPANTVITGYDRKVVTEINITPIPLDRPPFPLPTVQVPIYFTIQPGSAYLDVRNTIGPKGARLYYPNTYNYPPGNMFEFWNYDPDQKGWYVYGEGKVSADRSQVIPNPGVVIYEFTGAMASNPRSAPNRRPIPQPHNSGGDPVDLGTGLFVYSKTDLVIKDVIPLVLTRTYRQSDSASRAFGIGTNDSFDFFMIGSNDPNGYTAQDLVLPDGGRIHFQRTSPCLGPNGYCDFSNAVYAATSTLTDFFGATLQWQPCNPGGSWTMVKKDGTTLCFPESSTATSDRWSAALAIADRYGNQLTFARDGFRNLTQITSPNGRYIQLTYDSSNRITKATDNIGRAVSYFYDANGRLTQVTDANGGVWSYAYDSSSQMTSIQDARGIYYLTSQYDADGRVIQQTQADNTNFYFAYTTDPTSGNVTQTDMTDRRGIVKRTTYNVNGYKTSDILALGKPEQQTITYNHDPNTNLLTSVIDALNRETDYAYDANGNVTSITRLANTANAVTTSFTYDPKFSELASVIDPLNHTTTFQYDTSGNLMSITDPLNHQSTFTYNSAGQVLTATDAAQNTTQFSYDSGDLVGITDPLGNSTTRYIDNAGRLEAVTDALGRRLKYSYNALDQIFQITDPLQGATLFSYDLNGNLLSVVDANQNATTYTYNIVDRISSKTDPLLRTESYTYDANENVATFADRKGQLTTYTYDNLNRPNFVGFGTQGSTYASTITYQYDAGNRMMQSTDSVSGITTRAYDGLDRVTSETTSQGSISYTYDNASRRATMQVAGQSQVGYTFDNGNRLTQIAQGTSIVGFTYDNANRRSALTLPNAIVATYSYDNDSHLTGISYTLNSNSVGALSYGYDALGMRTSVSGSFARTELPQAIPTATYDSGNELLRWSESQFAYDANGNMLNDGVHNYGWDARDHLSTIDSGSTGTFVYDSTGRRSTKASSGTSVSFLYDLANPVQELSGTVPTANLLTNGLDEYFTRTDGNGTANFLTDALGNAAALSNPEGAVQTQYIYDPFGNSSHVGNSSTSSFMFTGRENDGTGLYYYRARYYNPSVGRFISQDPTGLRGGINAYVYAGDNPTNFTDPLGLSPNSDGIPDCGMDCVRTPQEQAAIEEAITARDNQLAAIEGADAVPASTAGRKPPRNHDDAQENCIRTANQNFVNNLNGISQGTAPDIGRALGIGSPIDTIPPLLQAYSALRQGLPIPLTRILGEHAGISLSAEGGSTMGPFIRYFGRANSDYDAEIAACSYY